MPENEPERPSFRMQAQRQDRLLLPCVFFAIGCALVVGLIAWVLLGAGTPNLTREQASATREAMQFATSQADRRATMRTERATGTVFALVTATAEAQAHNTASSQTAIASTAGARATAEAPPTLTAQAKAHETARVQAEATAQVLDEQANLIYGPSSGTLEQIEGDEMPCAAAGVELRDFVAEATFRNPQDGGHEADAAWDYGLVFSNIGEGTEYRAILDSEGSWTFNLHAPGYDISIRDTSELIDVSLSGSNTLKLYVTSHMAQFNVNGHYIDSLDLVMLGLGQSSEATHDVMVCAGVREEYTAVERLTRYEGFRVWSLLLGGR